MEIRAPEPGRAQSGREQKVQDVTVNSKSAEETMRLRKQFVLHASVDRAGQLCVGRARARPATTSDRCRPVGDERWGRGGPIGRLTRLGYDRRRPLQRK